MDGALFDEDMSALLATIQNSREAWFDLLA